MTVDRPQIRHNEVIISVLRLTKAFGSVIALKDVTFELRSGEVHILLGENGAGKSTLVNIILGATSPDAGGIYIKGQLIARQSPANAREQGVNAVFQDFSLAPSLKVYENLFLGREPVRRPGLLRKRHMRGEARRAVKQLGVDIDVDRPVSSLSRAEQQIIEIVRALGGKPGALLLDEPTATLSQAESDRLFEVIAQVKSRGWGVLYITHRLEEIERLGDRVTVLRDGEVVATHRRGDVTNDRLIQEMVGRPLSRLYPTIACSVCEPVLRVQNLSTGDGKVKNASFSVRKGEIVGIAGLVGSGKSELVRACFGLVDVAQGRILLENATVEHPVPRRMLELGLIYLPQDRRGEALALNRSVSENVSLEALQQRRFAGPLGLVRARAIRAAVIELANRLDIRPRNINKVVDLLSGGNQQKVVLGRAFTRSRSVYVFDEPTAGVDIAARQELYGFMKEICEQGAGIVLVSSDLPEIVHMSNRVYVMHAGRIEAELEREAITEEAVVSHFFGHYRGTSMPSEHSEVADVL